MKKGLIAACLLVLMASPATFAQGGSKFGVGVSGGTVYPIVQFDQGNGTAFAIRGLWALEGFGLLEPFMGINSNGDPGLVDMDGHSPLDMGDIGSKITMYGINFIMGANPGKKGLKPIFMGGVGFYKTTNEATQNVQEEETKLGFSGGLGIALGLSPMIELDGRGQLHVIPSEGGASKKSATVMVGVNLYFGSN